VYGVPTNELTLAQREMATENLMAADNFLDSLIGMVREHRRECSDKACTSPEFASVAARLPDHSVRQSLHVAVERLAAQ
jgi:hypothetical protein